MDYQHMDAPLQGAYLVMPMMHGLTPLDVSECQQVSNIADVSIQLALHMPRLAEFLNQNTKVISFDQITSEGMKVDDRELPSQLQERVTFRIDENFVIGYQDRSVGYAIRTTAQNGLPGRISNEELVLPDLLTASGKMTQAYEQAALQIEQGDHTSLGVLPSQGVRLYKVGLSKEFLQSHRPIPNSEKSKLVAALNTR